MMKNFLIVLQKMKSFQNFYYNLKNLIQSDLILFADDDDDGVVDPSFTVVANAVGFGILTNTLIVKAKIKN